jgi:hypothetical protein
MQKRMKDLFWAGLVIFPLLLVSGCVGQQEDGTCPDDLVIDETYGVCCPPDSVYNPNTSQCEIIEGKDVCPDGYYLDDNNVCQVIPISVVCPDGYAFDPAAGVCVGERFTGTAIVTPPIQYTTPPLYTPPAITVTQLVCPTGYQITTRSGIEMCAKPSTYVEPCPPGEILNVYGECVPYAATDPCPEGFYWDDFVQRCIDEEGPAPIYSIGGSTFFGVPNYLLFGVVGAIAIGLFVRRRKRQT